tara:strand:- start:698 stop:1141 length:444 start_codon:yes stop_codon:yes gene_type:complete
MDIDNILLDLEIIKQLSPDDKLAVSQEKGETKLYVHHSSHILPIKRWYYGYNRDETILYLEKLIDIIEKSSNVIVNGQHIDLSNLLKNSINSSLIGFNNLKNTYQNDSIINSKIILIENKLKTIYDLLEKFTSPTLDELEEIEKRNN